MLTLGRKGHSFLVNRLIGYDEIGEDLIGYDEIGEDLIQSSSSSLNLCFSLNHHVLMYSILFQREFSAP